MSEKSIVQLFDLADRVAIVTRADAGIRARASGIGTECTRYLLMQA